MATNTKKGAKKPVKKSAKKPVKKTAKKVDKKTAAKTNNKVDKKAEVKVADKAAEKAEKKAKKLVEEIVDVPVPEKPKKIREKKSPLTVAYMTVITIITLGIAGICGYYIAFALGSKGQRSLMAVARAAGTVIEGVDLSLAHSPMYSHVYYIGGLIVASSIVIALISGRYRTYTLALYAAVSSVVLGVVYLFFVKTLVGFDQYVQFLKLYLWGTISLLTCIPLAMGLLCLSAIMLRYNWHARRGDFDYLDDELPEEDVPAAEVQAA